MSGLSESEITFGASVPAGQKWIVSKIFVCNTSASSQYTFGLTRVHSAATKTLFSAMPLAAGDTLTIDGPINLAAGDSLVFTPSNSAVQATAFGLVVTL